MAITRRTFLEAVPLGTLSAAYAALGAAVDGKSGMPTRILGKTGARVSVLGFGCGSRLLSYNDEGKAVEALHKGMDLGITYIDTAFGYGGGKSETWVGKAIQGRRKDLWLVTKMQDRKGDDAMRTMEGSLKRLGVDQVDLVHMHALLGPDDLAKAEAPDGLIKALYKMRDQKMARFIGVTSHFDPMTLKTALERHDFDCTQMALNAALSGMTNGKGKMIMNRTLPNSFEHQALPVALKKKMGVTAMKLYAQEGLVGAAPLDKLMGYALSLPVAAGVVGMPQLDYIDENIKMAKAFKPLSKGEMKDLSVNLSREHKARLDRFFADHVDA
ncbi:MAG: aldo/keto reductase [Bryobacterales bacterium]|nr:aldo/keto reductase [Bryobacterales bacterium]